MVAAALAAAFPASASAKLRPYIPPGNSGANEYVESIPTAGGDKSTGNVIASGDTGSALAPSTRSALRRAGPDGRRTAAVANATAPRRGRHGVRIAATPAGGTAGGGAGSQGGAAGGSQAPAGGILRSLLGIQGQGGLGAALPALLIATMLAVAAGRVWRRRAS
jgi:hypothetical protein